jgi:ADP-heptose:LPS heptosyltransferase
MAAALGLSVDRPRFDVPVNAAAWDGLLGDCGLLAGPFAALCPGATAESKRFRPEGFAAVADRLHAVHGIPSVLLGSPAELPDCRQVAAACRQAAPAVLAGRTDVAEMVALLAHAGLCVANDSGPLHVAAALGTTVLGLYGPTDPATVGPYGQPTHVVRSPLPRPSTSYRRADRACIDAIPLPEVLSKLDAILASRKPRTAQRS